MIDREMRTLIRKFKATQPIGVRARTQQQMRDCYEMADEEGRAKMKESVRAALRGEKPKAEVAEEPQVAIPVVEYRPHHSVLEQRPNDEVRSGDSGQEAENSGSRI